MAQKCFLTMLPFSGGLMWNDIQARFAVDIREQLAPPIILQITLWGMPRFRVMQWLYFSLQVKAHLIAGTFCYFVVTFTFSLHFCYYSNKILSSNTTKPKEKLHLWSLTRNRECFLAFFWAFSLPLQMEFSQLSSPKSIHRERPWDAVESSWIS